MKKKSTTTKKSTANITKKTAVKSKKPLKATKKIAKKATTKKNTLPMLNGISDIRRFFYRNETPIYFISATNFNLLGAD